MRKSTLLTKTNKVTDEEGKPIGEVERVIPDSLPASTDKKFWKDANVEAVDVNKLSRPDMSKHTAFRQDGPYIICTSCPHEHTMPFDHMKYSVDINGKLIAST